MRTFRTTSVFARWAGLVLFMAAPVATGQNLRVQLVDGEGNGVPEAVVEVILPESLRAQFATINSAEVDQVDKEFVPNVTIVVAGSRVSFPNSDDILHHVYSFSPINTFDIPLYGSNTQSEYSEEFPLPGIVEIGCNIHDWMLAYIYVASSSKAALSDARGMAEVEALPAGQYPLRIWHARLPRGTEYVMAEATVTAGDVAVVNVALQLERDRRIRRAPSASRQRYR